MLVVLGVWGGLIPFIGPYFGYAFGSHATWHWTANRLWLDASCRAHPSSSAG